MVEGEYTHDDFDRIHIAQVSFLMSLKIQQRKNVPITVVIDSVTSDADFSFHVRSGPEL